MEISSQQDLLTRAEPADVRHADQPLVSIISFCKDRASTIRRSIESVLGQSYRNIEFVVQDGASTDGTLEILRSYNDPRIKIVSEKDSGPAEAFWKVMNRCQGDIIGTCLSDEELLPGAIERAVEYLRAEPHLGAITCDGYVTDADGKIINEFNAGEFNLVDYLFGWYCPFWPGSFFRRQALIDVGLKYHKWTIECLEFEIWCRLGTQHEVKYIPVRMSKYAIHDSQLSQTKQYFHEHFDNRAKVITALFSDAGFFGKDDIKLIGCLYNQLYLLYNHVKAYKLRDQMELLAERMHELFGQVSLMDRLDFLEYFSVLDGHAGDMEELRDKIHLFQRVSSIWIRVALKLPAEYRRRIPRAITHALHQVLTLVMFLVFNTKYVLRNIRQMALRFWREDAEKVPFRISFSPVLYHHAAQLYYARGQIGQALQMWRRAEVLGDPSIDGIAVQAMLMSPSATYENLLTAQSWWAERHAKPAATIASYERRIYRGARKIRIGYFCSFLDSDTVRFIMIPVIRNSDHEKFEIFGYSPSPAADDISRPFDRFRVTGDIPDEEFVDMVREDEIDVFVELTGFSPRHRFAAMASRCAPVQVAYLNHTGTTCVPNVDYVLADDISVHPNEDRYFSEKVWRLPGSFLCYNYDTASLPPIVEPPYLRNDFVTFGCFGSGGKINIRLIELWAKILHRVPGSKLFVRNYQLSTRDNRHFMEDRFRRFGIATERLRLLGGADRQTILKCYDEVDVSLDTWPYCGGNTVAEAIWQGVPVVTLKGNRFSGRYGASLIAAAGCADLVAETPEEYVGITVKLSRSPDRLKYYRDNLRRMARESGLSDAPKFAKKLDAAYIQMLQQRQGTG